MAAARAARPRYKMAASASAEWVELGSVFYRSTEAYELPWGVALSSFRVAAAKYGGPVALIRDESQLVQLAGGESRPLVLLFTAAGRPLGKFLWDKARVFLLPSFVKREPLSCSRTPRARF